MTDIPDHGRDSNVVIEFDPRNGMWLMIVRLDSFGTPSAAGQTVYKATEPTLEKAAARIVQLHERAQTNR